MPRYTKQTKRMRKGDILLSTYTDRTLVKHLQWQPLLKSPSVYMSHLTLQQPCRIIRLSAVLQRETTTRPSWLVSRACLHFPQTASNKHSVRRGTSVCSSSCSCSGGFELTFVCQCVSGMFDAALLLWWLTAVLFKPREWGPGLFPVGIHMWGGGYRCVWVILLCRDVRIGNWTPDIWRCHLCSYMPTALHPPLTKTKPRLLYRPTEDVKQKRPKSWSAAWGQNRCVPRCLVCRCLCYTAVTYLHRQPKENSFPPPAITIGSQILFMRFYRRMWARRQVGRFQKQHQFRLWQWETFLTMNWI